MDSYTVILAFLFLQWGFLFITWVRDRLEEDLLVPASYFAASTVGLAFAIWSHLEGVS